MKIELITKPDVTGLGRVVMDGKFYGLPVEAIEEWKTLQDDFEHIYWAYQDLGKRFHKIKEAMKK